MIFRLFELLVISCIGVGVCNGVVILIFWEDLLVLVCDVVLWMFFGFLWFVFLDD